MKYLKTKILAVTLLISIAAYAVVEHNDATFKKTVTVVGNLIASKIGVGTASPGTDIHIQANTTAAVRIETVSATLSPNIGFRRARGTIGSEALVNSSDNLGTIGFSGHTGVAYPANSPAVIFSLATENFSATANGASLTFATTANTTTTRKNRVRVNQDGALQLFGDTSGTLSIYPTAVTTSHSLTLPAAQGAADSVLANNGSGILSWDFRVKNTGDVMTGNLVMDDENEVQFREATANGTNYVSFKAPATLAGDFPYTLPINYGSDNQILTTDGAGVLAWETLSGGSSSTQCEDFTADGNYVANATGFIQIEAVGGGGGGGGAGSANGGGGGGGLKKAITSYAVTSSSSYAVVIGVGGGGGGYNGGGTGGAGGSGTATTFDGVTVSNGAPGGAGGGAGTGAGAGATATIYGAGTGTGGAGSAGQDSENFFGGAGGGASLGGGGGGASSYGNGGAGGTNIGSGSVGAGYGAGGGGGAILGTGGAGADGFLRVCEVY